MDGALIAVGLFGRAPIARGEVLYRAAEREEGKTLAGERPREIQAGVVHVNSETAGAEPQAPFGGTKSSSSHSREHGKDAVDFFTHLRTVYLAMSV